MRGGFSEILARGACERAGAARRGARGPAGGHGAGAARPRGWLWGAVLVERPRRGPFGLGAKIDRRGVLINSRNFRNLEPDNLPSDQKKNGELIGTDELAVAEQRGDGGGNLQPASTV